MRGSAAFRTGVAPGGALAPGWVKNELWRKARTVPSLDLRFADNKSLVDATTGASLVTFTRASSGTFVGSDGVLGTAVTNLLLRSEEFNDASWTKQSSVSVSANTTIAPNGTLTADTITADLGQGIFQSVTSVIGLTYTNSVYIKSGTATALLFRDDTGAGRHLEINPSTGAIISTAGTLISSESQNVGAGWYRYNMVYVADTTTVRGIIRPNSAGAAQTFITWGAQLEQSATVGEYIPTTSVINSAPRFDHNPTTGESLGLLVEEARTNLLVRSEEFENVAWTPSNVATPTANIAVAPDGTLTADKIITSNGLSSGLVFQTSALSVSTTYTFSAYAKAVEWGWTTLQLRGPENVSAGAWFDLTNGSVGTIDAGVSATIQAVGNGWYRCAVTKTTGTGVGTSRQRIYTTNANNVFTTGDGTSGIYLWGAQLEAGAFPTSYIPTTTAAATRSADVASIGSSAFSSWYRQDEGTVFAEAISVATNTSVFSISDNSTNNRIQLETGSNTRRFRITSSGSARYDNSVSYTFGTQGKTAGAYLNTSANHATNGTLGSNSTASPLPVVDRIYIGSNAAGSLPNNGTIKRLVYWGQRLPNNVLQAITQ